MTLFWFSFGLSDRSDRIVDAFRDNPAIPGTVRRMGIANLASWLVVFIFFLAVWLIGVVRKQFEQVHVSCAQ